MGKVQRDRLPPRPLTRRPGSPRQTEGMTHPVDRALHLWSHPVPSGDAALGLFRTCMWTLSSSTGSPHPSTISWVALACCRRRSTASPPRCSSRFDSPGRSVFAFRLSRGHVGPTHEGEVAPTGQQLTVLGMDIFAITDDRVTEVWAVADYLSLLMQTGAASLVGT